MSDKVKITIRGNNLVFGDNWLQIPYFKYLINFRSLLPKRYIEQLEITPDKVNSFFGQSSNNQLVIPFSKGQILVNKQYLLGAFKILGDWAVIKIASPREPLVMQGRDSRIWFTRVPLIFAGQ